MMKAAHYYYHLNHFVFVGTILLHDFFFISIILLFNTHITSYILCQVWFCGGTYIISRETSEFCSR